MGRLNDTDEIDVGTVSAADLIRIFSFEQMETAVTIVDSDLETGRFCVEFVDKRLHKSRNFVSTAVLAQRIDELLTGQAVEQGFGEPCVGFGLDRLEGLLSVFFSAASCWSKYFGTATADRIPSKTSTITISINVKPLLRYERFCKTKAMPINSVSP